MTALELVHDTPADRTVNLFDVSSGPVFEIALHHQDQGRHSTRDAPLSRRRLCAGRWSTEDIAPAGAKFGYIDAGLYVGGMAFPDRAPAGHLPHARSEPASGTSSAGTRRRPAFGTARDLVPPRTNPPDPPLGGDPS